MHVFIHVHVRVDVRSLLLSIYRNLHLPNNMSAFQCERMHTYLHEWLQRGSKRVSVQSCEAFVQIAFHQSLLPINMPKRKKKGRGKKE